MSNLQVFDAVLGGGTSWVNTAPVLGGVAGLAARTQRFTLPGDVVLEMMRIPGGTFLMGSPENEKNRYDDEGPQHWVTVPPFLMGKYPVTQAQWKAVMGCNPSGVKGRDLPVEQASWHDAVKFCDRLTALTQRSYRLPSEAEWEYACRAGTTTPYYFGETISKEQANFNGGAISPVGQYSPNAFGLYDMHGNVWEWCADDWHNNYLDAPTDGSAWNSKFHGDKVLRGGSWNDDPWLCRSAYRPDNSPDYVYLSFGFRVVFSSAWT
jgi:formylglycine-generating enzyme required for sulfatase activity